MEEKDVEFDQIDIEMKEDDLALWAKLNDQASKAEIKPHLIEIEDEEVRLQIQKAAEQAKQKDPVLSKVPTFFGRPVLGKILILPISGARQFTYSKPWAAISIGSHPSELPVLSSTNRLALLQLTFEDLDATPSPEFAKKFPQKAANLFKEEQAGQILDLICDYWTQIDLLMIHCYAGASRSPAVGKAISDCLQSQWSPYFDKIFQPNKLVYKTIKEVYAKTFEVYTPE